ncbi:MAG: MBL fold metallo-hydrolase [Oscillospiraceae bacterium]|nr:MBL fold metallo-hydrolase [Oscillospiraceae bacterium]
MTLTFLGAAHEVTGSCTLLEACGKNILIDCGLEQGPDEYENVELPLAPANIDCVLLTHAHIDHSGKLPLLYAQGFRGSIYATAATADLCDIMLRDSAHIQEFEAEWRNRKAQRAGKEMYVPLYTMNDAMGAIKQLVPCDYEKETQVFDGIKIRFVDAGHLLGSASIEIWVTENARQEKLVFSGDIGNTNQPIIKNPTYMKQADYVIMESTYGDRSHGPRPDYLNELTEILQTTFDRGGNVVIPAFAVGRTQEMLYFLRQIKEEKRVKGHGNFSVYVDSPLAAEATQIFNENTGRCFDADTLALVKKGVNPLYFSGLKISVTSDDSRLINFEKEPKVIISASGMCDAGRIKHHLKHNLWRPECTVLFVGYQAVGTLGRSLIEGSKEVKIFGESIEVQAKIKQLAGVSGHADNEGLMKWAAAFGDTPKGFFVIHGNTASCETMAQRIQTELHKNATAPYSGDSWNLSKEKQIAQGSRKKVEKAATEEKRSIPAAFARLLASGKRLTAVIQQNSGGTNKDLAKFTSQIEALCDKWQR